jgi:hypothetical protein
LRGEQHRGAVGHELVDDVPQVGAAGGVEAGGRLVQEQHWRAMHQGGGEVEAPPHAAGVGLRRAVGGVGEPEPVEQFGGPPRHLAPAEVGEPADEAQVLAPGQVLVDGRVLAGEADGGAGRLRMGRDVDAEHLGRAVVGVEDRGQDAHGGGLARTVRAEQPEHGAGRHVEVDAAERVDVAEALGEAADPDGGGGGRGARGCRGDHAATFAPIIDWSQ